MTNEYQELPTVKKRAKIIPLGGLEEYFGEDGKLELTIDNTTYFRKKESESWIDTNLENNRKFFEIVPGERNVFLETREAFPFDQDHLQHSIPAHESPYFLSCRLRSIINCYDNKSKFYDIKKKILPEFQGEFYFKSAKRGYGKRMSV